MCPLDYKVTVFLCQGSSQDPRHAQVLGDAAGVQRGCGELAQVLRNGRPLHELVSLRQQGPGQSREPPRPTPPKAPWRLPNPFPWLDS